ncbi:MAG: phosphoserine aminotransferase [Cellvibrionales bacterium TMED49]|nr:phosphoserine transaminase [Porticoccaceae bacterium]OUU38462.1 MAG: phosphoserine aminotransferase [Cellvibrionales bacterium TMED49]
MKPTEKPHNPNFSSGPCAKRPGYDVAKLKLDTLGRSHRSSVGKEALRQACTRTAEILRLPKDYRVGVVPASDTGAVELIMWSVLGERPVDVFAWESFGKDWVTDITKQLQLSSVESHLADYGHLPDMSQCNPANDTVFTWNGTTSGVRVPDADWISDDRTGLTICDATSAVFAMQLPWYKLDAVTYSWQKVLGGEGAHGMLILSPRAVQRLESYTPPWPLPKIFRLTKGGALNERIFQGATINTPSMLCVADYLDALDWVESLGGVQATIKRSEENLHVIESFVNQRPWINFLAQELDQRSNTSVCLTLDMEPQKVIEITKLLADEEVAYDIGAYRDAPAGLRIWCGATVVQSDLEALMPWIEWAFNTVNK